MKHLVAILAFTLASFAVTAQPGGRAARVNAAKVGFITDRLGLSATQAEAFWPIFHRYEAEQRQINRSWGALRRATRGRDANDEELKRALDATRNWQEARIKLQRRYEPEFMQVLTVRQVADLYQAERDFHIMLYQRLKKGRAKAKANRQ